VVENTEAQSSDRMISAVGSDTVREQEVCLLRTLESGYFAEHKLFRPVLSEHVEAYRSIKLTNPHVNHGHRGITVTRIQVVILHLALNIFPTLEFVLGA
jgi:hypothetical protein